MGTLTLFDSNMQFVMPSDADVAKLPAEAQQRFEAVKAASDKFADATKHREAIEARIAANETEMADTLAELTSLRPKWTPIDEARAFISARERGNV